MTVDRDIRAAFQNCRTTGADDVFCLLAKVSVVPALATGAGLTWFLAHRRGNRRFEEIAKRVLLGLVLSEFAARPVKWTIDRKRPLSSLGLDGWRGAERRDQSFPSGHTVNCFVTAAVISRSLDRLPVSVLAYGLAVLGALGRLERDKHWASDVIVGALIGYGLGVGLTWE